MSGPSSLNLPDINWTLNISTSPSNAECRTVSSHEKWSIFVCVCLCVHVCVCVYATVCLMRLCVLTLVCLVFLRECVCVCVWSLQMKPWQLQTADCFFSSCRTFTSTQKHAVLLSDEEESWNWDQIKNLKTVDKFSIVIRLPQKRKPLKKKKDTVGKKYSASRGTSPMKVLSSSGDLGWSHTVSSSMWLRKSLRWTWV